MEFSKVFEVVLSDEKINGKEASKVARLIFGKGTYFRGETLNNFSIVRLEISVNVFGQKSIAVQLTNAEFNWFINAFKNKTEKSVHVGKKIYVFNSVGDSTFTLASIEFDRIFGILLNHAEMDILVKNEKIFEFLLKNQNCTGSTLTDITAEFYTLLIGNSIKKKN